MAADMLDLSNLAVRLEDFVGRKGKAKVGQSSALAQSTTNQRCLDLIEHIQKVLNMIKQYEEKRRLSDDPKEKQSTTLKIDELRQELAEYEAEVDKRGCKEFVAGAGGLWIESKVDTQKLTVEREPKALSTSDKAYPPPIAEQYQIALRWADSGRKETMYGFNLSGCVLWKVDLERADLRMANLQNADLGRANLQKANLGGADLRGASLFNTSLHGAKIDETTQIDDKARLVLEIIQIGGGVRNRVLVGVDLSNAILVWGELSGADLSGSNLSGSTLNAAKLLSSNLREANLRRADLHMADLRNANLQEADMRQVDLRGADLTGTDLRGAILTDAILMDDLYPANMTGAKYNKSTSWPKNFNPQEWGLTFQD